MNEQQTQAQTQQAQTSQQMAQQMAKMSGPKTIVNGQEVSVKEAQAIEQEALKQNNQSGAVCAGEIAQNAEQLMQEYQQQQKAVIRLSERQSGQENLAQFVEQGKQAVQQAEQHLQQQKQQLEQQKQQAQQNMQGISEEHKAQLEDQKMMQDSLKAKAKAKKAEQ